jgi:hypothetical protein
MKWHFLFKSDPPHFKGDELLWSILNYIKFYKPNGVYIVMLWHYGHYLNATSQNLDHSI